MVQVSFCPSFWRWYPQFSWWNHHLPMVFLWFSHGSVNVNSFNGGHHRAAGICWSGTARGSPRMGRPNRSLWWQQHQDRDIYVYIQCEAPKIAKLVTWEFRKETQSLNVIYPTDPSTFLGSTTGVWFRGLSTFSDSVWIHRVYIYIHIFVDSFICIYLLFIYIYIYIYIHLSINSFIHSFIH
jgi:hypothetical protein